MKVMIGVATETGNISIPTMVSIFNAAHALQDIGVETSIRSPNATSLTAIDNLLNGFLHSDEDGILLVNENVSFTPETSIRLVNAIHHAQLNAGLIAGVVPQASLNWDNMLNQQTVDELKSSGLTAVIRNPGTEVDGYIQVESTSLKLAYISRSALQSISCHFYEMQVDANTDIVFMSGGIQSQDGMWLLPEDYFCAKLLEEGYGVYIDSLSPVVAVTASMAYGA